MGLFLGAWSILGADETDTRHLSVEAGLMVFDRNEAADRLGDWAEENGGYFTWKSDESVRLRVPDEAVGGFRDVLEEIGEGILQIGQSSTDLRDEMMRSRSVLEAREEILEKNIDLLDTSDVEGTLELEQEIRRLMDDIDASRGYLSKLEHDALMAVIEVSLSFRQQTVPVYRASRFEWINNVDFYYFLEDYPPAALSFSLGGDPIPVPDGFAKVNSSGEFSALSPEGVRIRIRKVKNYPEQNRDFWQQALKTDLGLRGYIPLDYEQESDWGDGRPFANCLWALPLGNEDYLYLTSIRVTGQKIEVLEMAGKAEFMKGYLKD